MVPGKGDTLELDDLQPILKIPWYFKLIFYWQYAQAQRMLKELREAVCQEIDKIGLDPADFPLPLQDERSLPTLFQRLWRLWWTPYDQLKEEFFYPIQRKLRVKRIFLKLVSKLEELRSKPQDTPYIGFWMVRQCPEPITEEMLRRSFDSELDQIEINLCHGGNDSVIFEVLNKLSNEYNIYMETLAGRESTAKGSIGHDRLNVKTQRPSNWRALVKGVMGQDRIDLFPILTMPQEFLLGTRQVVSEALPDASHLSE